MKQGMVLRMAAGVLRLAFWFNIVIVLGFVGALVGSVGFHDALVARLASKYGTRLDIPSLITAMRLMLLLGVVAAAAAWVAITRLRGIIATVAQGDPFIAINARRLQTIGWALLTWQILDVVNGVLMTWIGHLGADTLRWVPSLAGWIVTLLVFVLAHVFAAGTAMRTDLEGTV